MKTFTLPYTRYLVSPPHWKKAQYVYRGWHGLPQARRRWHKKQGLAWSTKVMTFPRRHSLLGFLSFRDPGGKVGDRGVSRRATAPERLEDARREFDTTIEGREAVEVRHDEEHTSEDQFTLHH